MTDLEKFQNLFKSVGIIVDIRQNKESCSFYLEEDSDNEKINGYSFFYTEFKFDPKGKFIEMGAYE